MSNIKNNLKQQSCVKDVSFLILMLILCQKMEQALSTVF